MTTIRSSLLRTIGCVLLLASATVEATDLSVSDYHIKGGFLFKLAQFVEWPAMPPSKSDSPPFTIAVVDQGEATPIFVRWFAGKTIGGRPVEIRSVSIGSLPKDAHILLVTRGAGVTPEEVREALGAVPTLLVGETEHFAERGGAVAFVQEGHAIRLTLCREHAIENGLKVSASLAQVARVVRSTRKS